MVLVLVVVDVEVVVEVVVRITPRVALPLFLLNVLLVVFSHISPSTGLVGSVSSVLTLPAKFLFLLIIFPSMGGELGQEIHPP